MSLSLCVSVLLKALRMFVCVYVVVCSFVVFASTNASVFVCVPVRRRVRVFRACL